MPSPTTRAVRPAKPLPALKGVRILSLALNLPGPAALMRCRAMGASCRKLEPPAPPGQLSGDPMAHYCPSAYNALHVGVRISTADLKTPAGQRTLHRLLASTDVLLTSFRPAALSKLGLDWQALHQRYPALSQVAVVGAPGKRANEPGHDLTYLAECGLVPGLDLPSTLYADMGGSLMVSEAVLQAVLCQKLQVGQAPQGGYTEVALFDAAAHLALPRHWGLTRPGPTATVGGGHAGYGVYACQDGRVAVAALEPHFALALCRAVGLAVAASAVTDVMFDPATRQAISAFFRANNRAQLDALAASADLPLHSMA